MSVGNGAVSEAGKGVLYIHGKVATYRALVHEYVSINRCFGQQRNKVRQGQRTQHVLDVLPFKIDCNPATRTSTVLFMCSGVECIRYQLVLMRAR